MEKRQTDFADRFHEALGSGRIRACFSQFSDR